jgi:hypothetical protein
MTMPTAKRDMSVLTSPPHLVFALSVLALGIVALFVPLHYVLPAIAVALSDGYIGLMLWFAACASQARYQLRQDELRERLPHLTTALVALPALALALMTAFAGLYIETAGVRSAAQRLESRSDALYFSAVTIATLGYGDFAPQTRPAKFIVVVELASGILLLVGAVPLLISRMASFGGQGAVEGARHITFEGLRIVLPAPTQGEITIAGGTFTWRGAGFAVTVAKSADGSITYVQDGQSFRADPAGTLVIDEQGRARQI